jgi:single-stranded DNA-specific DHH superfamily exonuclease
MNAYKKEIVSALSWFQQNRESDLVIRTDRYVIINAQDNIRPSIIGTIGSILSKGGDFPEGTFILSTAYMDDMLKVSLRIAGIRNRNRTDLRGIVSRIVERVGGEAGGHMHAAGAVVPREKEEDLIRAAKELLSNEALLPTA